MRIIRLEAENFKKLVAVDITPKGNVVEITGKNANGKSSVLDAIWAALGGQRCIQSKPIREGATKARIKLDMGEIVVTRVITEKGSTLTVENAEGEPQRSPQALLDDLVGALTFDPLLFTRLGEKDRFEQLRQIGKVDLNFDELARLDGRDFENRTTHNREAKTLRAQVEGIVIPAPTGKEPVDLPTLLNQQAEINSRRMAAVQHQASITSKEQAIKAKLARIEELRTEAMKLKGEADALKEELAAMNEAEGPEDLEALAAEGSRIQEAILNTQADAEAASSIKALKAKREDLQARADAEEAKAKALSEAMDARAHARSAALEGATFPVPGLSLGEGVVLFNGIPFEQASGAEQLRVSVAIAMAANPALRVLRISDGSLLDEDSLQMLKDMAEASDYQVWIERVNSTGTVGVVIEDGAVLADLQATA